MKKPLLLLFILLDVMAMSAAGVVLYLRMAPKLKPVVPSRKDINRSVDELGVSTTPAVDAVASTEPVQGIPPVLSAAATRVEPGIRKILFKYSNSKARQVALRADFTGWKAEPMRRDARGVWTYQANLTPGEYAYIFTADEKPVRDPANKHIKRIGTTQVSAIVVKPR
ncbi:MAG: hypothetical protein WC859_07270 [Elusimicrobiota bacterium]|jgi:hypothetical protein